MTEPKKKAVQSTVHDGHRKRLRSKLLSSQFDYLCQHELLELLLFYSIPRKDTNELAHTILNYYGNNFSTVFEASPGELSKIPGVGENTAALITLVKCIIRELEKEKLKETQILTTTQEIGDFVIHLFSGHRNEVFYAIFLNNNNKVISYTKITEGSVNEITVESRRIVEEALKFPKTKQVILAHNHPSGNLAPSGADMDTTRLITRALNTIDIRVRDHLVVSGNKFYSFLENELLF
ncbi:MAG: DNA repair protein RadC [Ruminococcaceae bacterium]|nr:DNA repair protein RadC [Oscillospiraceae bacterium]